MSVTVSVHVNDRVCQHPLQLLAPPLREPSAVSKQSFPMSEPLLTRGLARAKQQPTAAISTILRQEMDLETNSDPRLECGAEKTAQRVMQGGDLGIQRLKKTEVHVQRAVKDKIPGMGGSGSAELQEDVEELAREVALLKENAVTKDELAGSGRDHEVSTDEMVATTKAKEEAKAANKGEQPGGALGWLKQQVPDGVSDAASNIGREGVTRGVATAGALGIASLGAIAAGPAVPIAMAGTMAVSKGIEQTVTSGSLSEDEIERIKNRVLNEIESVQTGKGKDPYNGGSE